jgi:hypothetical protein
MMGIAESSLFLQQFTSEMSAVIEGEGSMFTEQKYQNIIIGILVRQGLHECNAVTASLLNETATALRQAFRDMFGEVWSFVILNQWSDGHGWTNRWLYVKLGNEKYWVSGVKHTHFASELEWPDKFNAYFIKEFACQEWVVECEPVCTSVQLKYKEKFGREVGVVVARRGKVGADIIGKSFSHCGNRVCVIAE